ncbi:hypothetical protein GCM10011509_23190 [Ornithinimicrobium pekingense]|uniref:Uncharacterized protein n=1 Tax=Ornithinimicrobium pekingense TaxID=384677 RepID=A0ABQ2F958_9MICO|nr:hypothetical protein GCM10011509_23190 [Ornithinimicrobium pekingense]
MLGIRMSAARHVADLGRRRITDRSLGGWGHIGAHIRVGRGAAGVDVGGMLAVWTKHLLRGTRMERL